MEETSGPIGLYRKPRIGGGLYQEAQYETGRVSPFMNNNNRQPMNNNNRRRGRNNTNNRPQNNNNRSGFDYLNQIDNKARGNASQMLEKYKKLASDAQLNGDRVTAESYLQFADHYFRVLADFRSRQEARQGEGQNRQRDDNSRDDTIREEGNENRDDWRDDARENNYTDQELSESGSNNDLANTNDEGEREERPARQPRNNDRNPRSDRPDRNANRAPRRHHSEEAADEAVLDLAVLPPSIAIAMDNEIDVSVEAKPARKPRARRPKSANDEDVVTAAE
jgi:Domain of unknown function (DUF4167)